MMSLWLAFFPPCCPSTSPLLTQQCLEMDQIWDSYSDHSQSAKSVIKKTKAQSLARGMHMQTKLAALPVCLCQGTKRILTRSKWSAVMHVLLMKYCIAVINARVPEWRQKRKTQGLYTLIIRHWGITLHLFPKAQNKCIPYDNTKVLLMTRF